MLLNLSNHSSASWPENQMHTAIQQYGKVEDLPFPAINPEWSTDEVRRLVAQYEIKVRQLCPSAVHIMGELTFTFMLVNRLKEIGIPCIASATNRMVTSEKEGIKTSVFEFVRFREY